MEGVQNLLNTLFFRILQTENQHMMIAIPTLLLALVCLLRAGRKGWWIPLGLLLSAVGDTAGSMGQFEVQMGAFALALACYMADFAPYGRLTKERVRPLVVAFLAFCTAFGFLIVKITSTVEAFSVGLYAVVLLSMLSATLIQHRPRWGWYAVAALLFVLSDGLIGYSRYVSPLPAADWWILPPYYAAQVIFAWRYLKREEREA